MTSKLVNFYLGEETNGDNYIHEMWGFCDDRMEYGHAYIQWLFPLREPSNFNPDAPLVTDEDVIEFKSNPILAEALLKSTRKFCEFLNLDFQNNTCIRAVKESILWKKPNHNWMRITRMLASLRLLGQEEAAKVIFKCLKELRDEGFWSGNSFAHWEKAMAC